jgi:hypothetical protein
MLEDVLSFKKLSFCVVVLGDGFEILDEFDSKFLILQKNI